MNNSNKLPENNINKALSHDNYKTTLMKYLQNPVSMTWTKLAALTQSTSNAEEEIKFLEENLEDTQTLKEVDDSEYINFINWLEPSIYYIVNCSQKHL